jgi:hypothetical protein
VENSSKEIKGNAAPVTLASQQEIILNWWRWRSQDFERDEENDFFDHFVRAPARRLIWTTTDRMSTSFICSAKDEVFYCCLELYSEIRLCVDLFNSISLRFIRYPDSLCSMRCPLSPFLRILCYSSRKMKFCLLDHIHQEFTKLL